MAATSVKMTLTDVGAITGSLCPHPGPVGDQEGLGVRRGLQEEVQDPECAGEGQRRT